MKSNNFPSALDMAVLASGVAMLAVGIAIMVAGPTEPMPVHYNALGQADRWSGRGEVGGIVAFLGALVLAVGAGLGWAAGRTPDASRARGLRAGQIVTLVTTAPMALLTAAAALSGVQSLAGGAPMAAVSLVMLLMGAFLGRVGPNPVVGVRTPWTFKSRLAWERSNRLAGRLFFVIGLAGLAAAAFAPQPAGFTALIAGVLLAAAWSVFESWRVWRNDPERQPF